MRPASKRLQFSAIALAAVLNLFTVDAHSADLLGLYVGASIGEAHVRAKPQNVIVLIPDTPGSGLFQFDESGNYSESHTAFKIMAGIRPISLVGIELSYQDFGKPSGSFNYYPASVAEKGESAFALLYLPVPIVDVFVKAGIASIRSDINGTAQIVCRDTCPFVPTQPFSLRRTDTSGANGLGTQFKLGSLGLRVEYERFHAASAHPDLLSAGVTWTF